MAFIAVMSVPLALFVPLLREGRPHCLTVGQSARWLIARPGGARCTDCHAQRLEVMTMTPMPAPPSCPGAVTQLRKGTSSCVSCHQAVFRS
jgi:hypothetical protein